jgi:predicted NUDIX family NTP pyrophosphohydrolase
MFRRAHGEAEVFLVHLGGPFFRNKDDGAWTIPKGEVAEGEALLERARIEFNEELGLAAPTPAKWIEMGTVKQKGGKTVHAWAFEGDCPADFAPISNTFVLEWPPRSGRTQQFPEVDRAEFFSLEQAKRKINPAQVIFLDRLEAALRAQPNG